MAGEQQETWQEYLDERKSLVEAEKSVSASFDRAILNLSGGALALSILFIRQVAQNPTAGSQPYLIMSWIFFGAAIVLMLASMLTSQSAMRRQREIIGALYSSSTADQVQDNKRNTGNKNWFATLTNWLNVLAMGAFIFGVASLSLFSALNLFPEETNG